MGSNSKFFYIIEYNHYKDNESEWKASAFSWFRNNSNYAFRARYYKTEVEVEGEPNTRNLVMGPYVYAPDSEGNWVNQDDRTMEVAEDGKIVIKKINTGERLFVLDEFYGICYLGDGKTKYGLIFVSQRVDGFVGRIDIIDGNYYASYEDYLNPDINSDTPFIKIADYPIKFRDFEEVKGVLLKRNTSKYNVGMYVDLEGNPLYFRNSNELINNNQDFIYDMNGVLVGYSYMANSSGTVGSNADTIFPLIADMSEGEKGKGKGVPLFGVKTRENSSDWTNTVRTKMCIPYYQKSQDYYYSESLNSKIIGDFIYFTNYVYPEPPVPPEPTDDDITAVCITNRELHLKKVKQPNKLGNLYIITTRAKKKK